MQATKTAVIYRPFLWLEVKQDIDTMLYNANDMLEAYNKQAKPWEKKEMYNYIKSKPTQEYIEELKKLHDSEQLQSLKFNSVKTGELELSVEKPKVIWVIETKKGKFWGTRMNSHLLIDFMMWLSPQFKHQAIDFILTGNSLALWRNKIKEWYKQMCKAIAESGSANYREEATLLNVLCTGSPSANQRARYGEDKQELMDDMQKANATLITAWLDLDTRKNLLIKQFLQ